MGLIISGKMAKTIRLLDLKLDMLYPRVLKILTTSGKSHHPIETFWVNFFWITGIILSS